MDLELKGKFAIVCASTKGLGFAVAKSLLDEGCEVLISSSKDVNISKAEAILNKEGYVNFHMLKADLSKNEGIANLFKFATLKSSKIDILVQNPKNDRTNVFHTPNNDNITTSHRSPCHGVEEASHIKPSSSRTPFQFEAVMELKDDLHYL